MENHPIPQNVTGFQFRLIGTMTVKQFAYVAAGAVLAIIIYYIPIIFPVKAFFIIFFALFGLGLAFVPIEGRSMDAMMMYYFRALFAPNQYIYRKKGGRIAIASISFHKTHTLPFGRAEDKRQISQAKQANLQTLLRTVREGKIESDAFDKKKHPIIISLEEEKPFPQITYQEKEEIKEVKDISEQEKAKEQLDHQIEMLQSALAQARTQITPQADHTTFAARQKIIKIQQQLQEVQKQKKQLEEDIVGLQHRLASQIRSTDAVQKSSVRKIPAAIAQSVGLPKVTNPNLIAGIVKDARGNVLPNILIEVRNQDGNPVRAFKTNGLGQFVSATPLLRGTYRIELEDPREVHKFDTIEMAVDGSILDPLEIISIDQREELRKSLFAT